MRAAGECKRIDLENLRDAIAGEVIVHQSLRIADSRARAEAAEESARRRGRSQWTENPQIELKAEGVKAKDCANDSEQRIMQRAKELGASQIKEIGTRVECPKTLKENTEDRVATSSSAAATMEIDDE